MCPLITIISSYKIFYWRTTTNLEVDFILYGQRGLKAFEIKRTNKVWKSDLKGIKAFLKDYPLAEAYFVYSGDRIMSEGKISILPINYALKNLNNIL